MISCKNTKTKDTEKASLTSSDVATWNYPFTFSYEFKHLIDINYCVEQYVVAKIFVS